MEDSNNDLLAQAQEIQKQGLLKQAQSIQQQKMLEANPPGGLQSFGEHLLQSGSAGYAPQIEAGIQKLTGMNQDYLQARDLAIKRLALEQKQHPITSGLGTGVGLGASVLAMPAIKGMGILGSGLTGLATRGAIYGAGTGFAANPGDIPGKLNPFQGSERIENAKLGGAIGALANPILSNLGGMIYGRGARKLLQSAEMAGKNSEEVKALLLEKGIYGPERSMQSQINNAQQNLGPQLGQPLAAANRAGNTFSMNRATEDATQAAKAIREKGLPTEQKYADKLEEMIAEHRAMELPTPGLPSRPGIPAEMKNIRGPLDGGGWPTRQQIEVAPQIPEFPGTPDIPALPISNEIGREGKTAFGSLQNASSWNPNIETPKMASEVYEPLRQGFQKELERNVEQTGGAQALADYQKANAEYGMLASTKKGSAAAIKLGENRPIISRLESFAAAHPKILATKKAFDVAMSPMSMTTSGYGLTRAGTNPQFLNYVMQNKQPIENLFQRANPWSKQNE